LSAVAVLLMAYGTPRSMDEIEPYLTDIRKGRKPNPQTVEELKERYRKIGGRSPLLEIANKQASALEASLKSRGLDAHVYVGMKHWHPYIREVVPRIIDDGSRRIIALALAPHYSEIGIGGYRLALQEALHKVPNVELDFVESWSDNSLFHEAVAEKVKEALKKLPLSAKIQLVFTAHSLPERILEKNDPYPSQLRSSCKAVATLLNISDWVFAYQSAGQTDAKWLGPDILELLAQLSSNSNGTKDIVVVPIGFVSDHLEILYDIDIEAQDFAKTHRLNLLRTESLNATPTFITALADIVMKRLNK
jgi:ferrochelatase